MIARRSGYVEEALRQKTPGKRVQGQGESNASGQEHSTA